MEPLALRRRGERHRALRELHRRADHRRRGVGFLPGENEQPSRGAAVVSDWRIVCPSLGFRLVSIGKLNETMAHPREVFRSSKTGDIVLQKLFRLIDLDGVVDPLDVASD